MDNHQPITDARWTECLRMIKNNIQEQQFETWFAPIHTVMFDDERRELTLCVPSPFVYEYIEAHFIKFLSFVLKRVYGEGVHLIYKVMTDATNHLTMNLEGATQTSVTPKVQTALNRAPRPLQTLDPQLKPEYTFDNFVEGAANKLPRTVGLAIAQNPKQTTFNPLFIYGGSGTGKTHLVNAIGLRLKELHPELRVLYVSAHLFQVQYTDSVRQNTVNDFISFYQSIDVLIIDDIQEFSAMQKTQLTFFHIFNHLHQNGKQLILTSDRPPVALQGMEERLLTRFKWGLLAELENADETLRRDILLYKIRRDGLHIEKNVVDFIAKNVTKSIRDLEGVLTSLMAYSVVNSCEIDINLAERVISRTVGLVKHEAVTIERIIEFTSNHFEQDVDDMLSGSRKAPVVLARQIAMFLAQKMTRLSTTRIGMALGHRGHATVIHSCQVISQRLETDPELRHQLKQLEDEILHN